MQLPARYISITREGGYYLLVLVFIVGGAILREVNLLVILAGMMIGPLIFSWRWAMLSLSNLSARRYLPQRISAGDPLVVDIEVTNHRRRLTTYALNVADQLQRELPYSDEEPTSIETVVASIRAHDVGQASYRCLITRRGRYRFGPMRLSSRFPLGLVVASERLAVLDLLVVCPRIGTLTKRWDQWLEAERSGSQRSSSRRGLTEGDYYGMREWRSGDSQRWIHWRTSARLNEIAVRQFEEQRNSDVAIVLDLWTPPAPGDAVLGNIEVAVSAAATAVADLCQRGTNMLAVSVHALDDDGWSAPASSTFAQDILERLAVVEPTHEDRLVEVLERTLRTAVVGTRMIIFSTRSVDLDKITTEISARHGARQQASLARTIWVDVTDKDFASLFVLD